MCQRGRKAASDFGFHEGGVQKSERRREIVDACFGVDFQSMDCVWEEVNWVVGLETQFQYFQGGRRVIKRFAEAESKCQVGDRSGE